MAESILIVSPLDTETRNLRSMFTPVLIEQDGKRLLYKAETVSGAVYFGVSGEGQRNTERFFRLLNRAEVHPGLIILAGYGGGLLENRTAGALIAASHVTDAASRESWKALYKLPSEKNTSCGGVVTVTAVAHREEKEKILSQYPLAAAIDMESSTFVKECRVRNWKWAVIRAVSDPSEFIFPPPAWIRDRAGDISLKAWVNALLFDWKTIIRFLYLQKNLKACRKNLAEYLSKLIRNYL